jgi:hypothetical protein
LLIPDLNETLIFLLVCGDFSGLYSVKRVKLFAELANERGPSPVLALSEAELGTITGLRLLRLNISPT